jgi:hypothetical protein
MQPARDDHRAHRLTNESAWMLLLPFFLVPALGGADAAQQRQESYPRMAPMAQYLETSPDAEVALARSAAPASISGAATVLALTAHGYETAAQGTNGFTCIVERSWTSPFDSPEFWNPRHRAPICYNAPAARSVLPYTLQRTKLVLSGLSKAQMLDRIRAAGARGELLAPEPAAMSFMLSKDTYLGDGVGHWHPHLMFHVPKTAGSSWGANLPHSPVLVDTDHQEVPEPQTIFFVPVSHWSDGTAAQ